MQISFHFIRYGIGELSHLLESEGLKPHDEVLEQRGITGFVVVIAVVIQLCSLLSGSDYRFEKMVVSTKIGTKNTAGFGETGGNKCF
jgi:hypothetical protein